jgi:hypothetical protein
MSSPTNTDSREITRDDEGAPGVEPWLKVSFLAFVPLLLAFYLPDGWKPYLFVAGGLLVLWSMVMLLRQERRGGRDVRG